MRSDSLVKLQCRVPKGDGDLDTDTDTDTSSYYPIFFSIFTAAFALQIRNGSSSSFLPLAVAM